MFAKLQLAQSEICKNQATDYMKQIEDIQAEQKECAEMIALALFSLSNYDNVIYMNTFSKTISPALRVGYMVLPKCLVSEFDKKLGFYSCTVPTFEQFVLAELINSGDFERHINRVRRSLRKKH